jgi:hypothetical protein
MARTYLFAFDHGRGAGVREHFFHFMWGYLLPALSAIIDIRSRAHSGQGHDEFIFTSCGPVMDGKTAEMARLLGVEFSIVQGEREARRSGAVRTVLPRWDSFLCDHAQYARLSGGIAMLRVVRQMARQRSWPPILWSRGRLIRKIRRVREVVLEQVLAREAAEGSDRAPRCYYILERSAQPTYYAAEGGGATEPTYGTSRRSLVGIDRAAIALSRDSCRVGVFEPGAHTLEEQIRTFSRCQGIIALRGAELANVVWLEPGSRVIVVNAGTFQLPAPPAWTLARLLGISYVEIDWGNDPYPTLTDAQIDRKRAHAGD